MMQKPKALSTGDTIGIVAPASPSNVRRIQSIQQQLRSLGYRVKFGRSCYENHGYLAGSDELRAEDINNMFRDHEIQGIICLRGGYGTMRILHSLDLDLIKANPKIFVGYSDITFLHIVMNQMCHLVTFHGPMAATEISKSLDAFTKDSFLRTISIPEAIGVVENPIGEKIICLVEGEAKGTIVGGNLALVTATLGTPYEIDTRGKLLFLEDIGEAPYRIDRMLMQLALAGKFTDAAGIILGNFHDCDLPKGEESLSFIEVLQEIIVPYDKPTIYNLQVGHCTPMITLPLGVEAVLKATEGKLVIKEAATRE